jgi:hypothetical protein
MMPDFEPYFVVTGTGPWFVTDPVTETQVAGPFAVRSDADFVAGYMDGRRELGLTP